MAKPTKRVTKTLKITLQMTENRAANFTKMLDLFLRAVRTQPHPNEYLSDAKGDYLEIEES